MLIKSRNFSPTKCEGTYEKDGFGWAPGQEKKFEGTQSNSARYTKNYSLAFGACKKCDKYEGKPSTDGSHCSLPINEHCQV
ncbi:hypothetical protein LCGC14_0403560 [marine sediment metagenome]|uniref:Uncharacterized protein n=1 Tax=marine sediment metagenome TaxID=412755 RepID=A0A0F9W551_9ZZZZ